jgi:DNA-binding CsgD family transcriptional regulator
LPPPFDSAFRLAADEFCAEVRDIATPTEVLAALNRVSGYCGMTVFSCWAIPAHAADVDHWRVGQTVFYGPDFKIPRQYVEEYTSLTARYGVSALISLSREAAYAFTLTEAMRALKLTGKQDWIFDLMRRFGARDGLYCPYRNSMLFYSSPVVLSLHPTARGGLFKAGGAAVGRIGELVKRPVNKRKKPILSPRELEVLRLRTYKSPTEIAEQMKISVNTVNAHLKRTYGKLGVYDGMAAVAKAFRLALLRVDE